MTSHPDVGTFVCYTPRDFKPRQMEVIQHVNRVAGRFEANGDLVSVRQVYYQLVTMKVIPNNPNEYKKLVNLLTDARMAGLVSWTAFEDRNRELMGINTVDGPPEAMDQMLQHYALDLWANQDWRPEVWIEKKSLTGTISRICTRLRVDFFATAGHSSVTELWTAGQRLRSYIGKGQRPIIFYLGDHDPTGAHIPVNVRERLAQFTGTPVIVQRIALNMDQIRAGGYPPDPVKVDYRGEYTDSRAKVYVEQWGEESWELDVLTPPEMENHISKAILAIRDEAKWEEMVSEETMDKRVMQEMVEEKFGKERAKQDEEGE